MVSQEENKYNLTIKQDGIRMQIMKKDYSEATKSLGIWFTPANIMDKELEYKISKAQTFGKQLRQAHLTKQEAWTAIINTTVRGRNSGWLLHCLLNKSEI